ncbi:MAG: ABC transporter substrate-binding protein [Pseudomonadota bacterium]
MLHILYCGAAIAALSVGFAAAPTMAQNGDGAVTIGADVDAGTLDPRVMRDTTAYRVANLLYDGLVELSPTLEATPGLAESWENPEPTVWVFTLRDGATFHDGTPVTAADVVYTFETILDPELASRWRTLFTPISEIVAADDNTVRITLSEPYAPLLSYLDIGIVPANLVEGGTDIGTQPVGSGPFMLASWERGSTITLEPNPNWWAGEPSVAGIDFIVVPDNTARAQAFEAGDLDLIQSPLSPADIQRLADESDIVADIMGGLGVTYLNFNTQDPLLSDPQMRRALAMLVDQETIVEAIYEGVDVVASSVLLPSWPAYSPDIQQPTFDPDGAVAILEQLGWSDSDGDGTLDMDGVPLTLTLSTHSEDPNRIQAVEYIQNVMRGAGIDAQVSISDWPSFSGSVQNSQHQVALLGWLNLVDPDRLLYGQLHSGGALNWGGYANPTLDGALDRGRTTLDPEGRAAAYQEAAEIIADEVPYYIISYQGYQVFHTPEIEGYEPNPRGMMRSLMDN